MKDEIETAKTPDYEFWAHLYDRGTDKTVDCNISVDGGYITISIQDMPDVCVELYNGKIKIHK